MPGNFISSGIMIGARRLILDYGGNPDRIALRANVSPEALDNSELLVPVGNVIGFFELAAQSCGDPAWGLRQAVNSHVATIIGPLWILLRNADTVGQMLEDLARNFDLYTGAALTTFDRTTEGAAVTWAAAAGVAERETQMAEFALAVLCNEIRTHCGGQWTPRATTFRHAPPRDLRRHHDYFGQAIHFNQDRNALLLSDDTLQTTLSGSGSHTRSLVRAMLRQGNAFDDSRLAMQVETVVRKLLPFAPCSIENVSLAMGMAPRTLQARLQNQDRSFRGIRDTVRADLSLKYLRDSNLSVGQIADLLGYTDLTAFSRSFRRWHGKSARAIRAGMV